MSLIKTSGISTRCSGFLLAALLSTTAATPLWAASEALKPHVGIAAQVGDEAISSVDVDNRVKFVITTAHISNAPDVLKSLRPRVIRSLVDERLQVQEATKNDIVVKDKDVDQAIEGIEQQRGMPPGTITKMLEANNVPKDTFRQQVRAQLSWNKLLVKKIRPQVHVSDAEVAMLASRVKAEPATKIAVRPQEYKIAVLALPVEKPSKETETQHLSEKLVQQIRGGANFEEVSRHFSSSAASASGQIETFWVTLQQVDPRIARVLEGAKTGMIIDPVRTDEGFTIIKVYETRDIPGSKAIKKDREAAKVGATDVDDKTASHDQAFGMLLQQKMELEAQKYLRNLRRETFIEIR
jgi:peptidyl-prolyl cis-trans isomerase SurA